MSRNITILLDEETARWVRVEAAKRDTSVSQFLADILQEQRERLEGYAAARTRYLSRKPTALKKKSERYPSRAQVHQPERKR
jgi:hypothetical protein